MRGGAPKVALDWMFFTRDQEPGVQLSVLVVYDTGAVMAMQSTKDSSVETVGAVVQPLETWRHIDVVLHADGEQRASYETVGEGDCERQGA